MDFGNSQNDNTRNNTANNTGDNAANSDDKPSWQRFAKALLHYFILSLLLGLFGSEFIYLTSRGSNDLNTMFPTDDLFYTAKRYEVERTGSYTSVNCNETGSGSYSSYEDNFPYNLIRNDPLYELSYSQRISSWFGKTVAGCFKTNRGLIKGWIENFPPNTPLGTHAFQIYIACPITLLISFVGLLTGFFAAVMSAMAADITVSIWGGLTLYGWLLTIGLGFVIFIRLITTLCVFPMIQNWKEVSNIMACNAKTIVIMFGFFVCGAAYDNLDSTIAGIMGIIYLILVAHTLWKFFSSQNK